MAASYAASRRLCGLAADRVYVASDAASAAGAGSRLMGGFTPRLDILPDRQRELFARRRREAERQSRPGHEDDHGSCQRETDQRRAAVTFVTHRSRRHDLPD
jgi:hypothetical protein